MARYLSAVDGIEYEDYTTAVHAGNPYPGVATGGKLLVLGQTGNTAAANVANQMAGCYALPALAAGATGTLSISNSLITANSLILCQVRVGTTTAAADAYCEVSSVQAPAAGSVVLNLVNRGSAATLSSDFHVWIVIIN